MKSLGSLAIAIVVAVIILWVLVKLVFFTFKLIGLAIAIFIGAAIFLGVRRMIEGPGGRA